MDAINYTFIKSNKRIVKVYFDDILYVKGMGNYVEILLIDKSKHIYYKSLKDIIDALPDSFMRVHNSYIVNLTTIDAFEDHQVIMQDHQVPVGKSYRECLKDTLEKLLL